MPLRLSTAKIMDHESTAQRDTLSDLLSISRTFKQARVLQLAVKLRLFNVLATDDAAQHGFRGVVDFLDLLVALGALDREGDGESALYRNTPEAAEGLVEGRPGFIGGIFDLNYDRCYVQFEYLEDVLRDGQLPPEATARCAAVTDVFRDGGAAAAAFARGMTGATLGNAREFARAFDFSRYSSFADVGGSVGCAAVCVAAAHPHLRCDTYDLPNVAPAARAYVAEHQSRAEVRDIDFFQEPFPRADVIMLGMILHDWSLQRKRQLLRKAFAALPPGGALVAVEMLIDDERRAAGEALARSLSMSVEFGREYAFDFSFKEFRGWAAEAGFSSTARLPLLGSTSAAIAYK